MYCVIYYNFRHPLVPYCTRILRTCGLFLQMLHVQLQLQLQSFTLKQLFSEESCSAVGLSEKMSFQLRSELSGVSATVER